MGDRGSVDDVGDVNMYSLGWYSLSQAISQATGTTECIDDHRTLELQQICILANNSFELGGGDHSLTYPMVHLQDNRITHQLPV